MSLYRTARFAAIVFSVASALSAADVWVVNGLAMTPAGGCTFLRWQADAVLHNTGSEDAIVKLVDASNGAFVGSGTTTIPASTSTRLFATTLLFAPQPLYVVHLDIPPAVAVEGRLDVFNDSCAPGAPPALVPSTHIALPVIRHLAAANEVQFHPGTDLGTQDVRLNVAIYNASSTAANASVVMLAPFCADRTRASTEVSISPNTIVQFPLTASASCTGAGAVWSRAVQVTSDQPGFSFVSVLANAPLVVTAAVVSEQR